MNAFALLLAAILTILPSPARAGEGKLRVLASFLPMYIFTENVAANVPGVSVELLLPPSLGGPHGYSLTPGDMRKIVAADVFIANGYGMEEFLGDPVRRANPSIRVVETASAVPPIRTAEGLGEVNPHTWASPRSAVLQVRAIEKALSEASPGDAPAFRKNADAYAARLAGLADEFETAAARFRNRNIVTFHNAFDYLARDLGLSVVGRIEEAAGQEPSAGEIEALLTRIRQKGVAAVFAEPQYPARLAEIVADEAGVPVRILDPVVTGSTSPSAYEDAMRRNLRTLKETLGTR